MLSRGLAGQKSAHGPQIVRQLECTTRQCMAGTDAEALCCCLLLLSQFSALGVGCAGAAVLLYEGIRVSEVILRPLPRWASAPLGGLLCGIIAFKFPQVRDSQDAIC
jgi:hypothetical protein